MLLGSARSKKTNRVLPASAARLSGAATSMLHARLVAPLALPSVATSAAREKRAMDAAPRAAATGGDSTSTVVAAPDLKHMPALTAQPAALAASCTHNAGSLVELAAG